MSPGLVGKTPQLRLCPHVLIEKASTPFSMGPEGVPVTGRAAALKLRVQATCNEGLGTAVGIRVPPPQDHTVGSNWRNARLWSHTPSDCREPYSSRSARLGFELTKCTMKPSPK